MLRHMTTPDERTEIITKLQNLEPGEMLSVIEEVIDSHVKALEGWESASTEYGDISNAGLIMAIHKLLSL